MHMSPKRKVKTVLTDVYIFVLVSNPPLVCIVLADEDFEVWDLDDVDLAFDLFKQLKYSQHLRLAPPNAVGLEITPYAASFCSSLLIILMLCAHFFDFISILTAMRLVI